MEIHEMKNCLSKFYLSVRKQDGSHYKKTSLLSIRAALDRYLRSPPLNKKFSICDGIQFNETKKALNSYLKHLVSAGKITGTIHKSPLAAEFVQKLFEAGELASADTKIPRALLQTAWFYVSLYFGKRGRENQSLMKKSMLLLAVTASVAFVQPPPPLGKNRGERRLCFTVDNRVQRPRDFFTDLWKMI